MVEPAAGSAMAAQEPPTEQVTWSTAPTGAGRTACCELAPPSVVTAIPLRLRAHSVAETQLTSG